MMRGIVCCVECSADNRSFPEPHALLPQPLAARASSELGDHPLEAPSRLEGRWGGGLRRKRGSEVGRRTLVQKIDQVTSTLGKFGGSGCLVVG